MLDLNERGMTSARIDEIFNELKAVRISHVPPPFSSRNKKGLVPLIAKVTAKPRPEASWLLGKYDLDTQKKLSVDIAYVLYLVSLYCSFIPCGTHCRSTAMGFDFTKGRLDVSVHPFSGGAGATDVRMATRYKDEDLMDGLSGTIHEASEMMFLLALIINLGWALAVRARSQPGHGGLACIALSLDGHP